MPARLTAAAAALAVGALALGACSVAPPERTGPVQVLASTSVWGGLAAQVAGRYADVRTVISNPAADPHDYEPTVADARRVARADVLVVNGAGYDAWATSLAQASPRQGREVVEAAAVAGVPNDGNPHVWYSPSAVRAVVARIAEALSSSDPEHADRYAAQRDAVLEVGLAPYLALAARIRAEHAGAPVAATESVVEPLAEDLGLRLLTPAALLAAVSEGAEPTPADRATVLRQLRTRSVRVLLYNSQNSTPDVEALVEAARAAGVPVVTVTETPTPAGTSFEQWQLRQLDALEEALRG